MHARCSGPQDTPEALGRAAALAAREVAAANTKHLLQADRAKGRMSSTKKDRKRWAKAKAANNNNDNTNNNIINNDNTITIIVAPAVNLVDSSVPATASEPLPHSDAAQLPSLINSQRGDVNQQRQRDQDESSAVTLPGTI